ncbi:GtrA family protein [Mariniluteicoccus endophyticus]
MTTPPHGHPDQLPHNIELPLEDREPSGDLKQQLVRFIATGVLSAIVDFGLLLILTHFFGASQALGKAISFIAGTTTAYMINRRWTFKAEPSTKRLIAVWATYGLTFVLQVGLYALLFRLLDGQVPGLLGLSGLVIVQTICFVIAQGVATVCNFVVQRVIFAKLDQ